MEKLLDFLNKHEALLAAIPGLVEGIYGYIESVLNRGGTDAEKQAKLDKLAVELKALAADYRANPPELPA